MRGVLISSYKLVAEIGKWMIGACDDRNVAGPNRVDNGPIGVATDDVEVGGVAGGDVAENHVSDREHVDTDEVLTHIVPFDSAAALLLTRIPAPLLPPFSEQLLLRMSTKPPQRAGKKNQTSGARTPPVRICPLARARLGGPLSEFFIVIRIVLGVRICRRDQPTRFCYQTSPGFGNINLGSHRISSERTRH
jgi:hypothetical protein